VGLIGVTAVISSLGIANDRLQLSTGRHKSSCG
jgi:hypothetical protein